MRLTRETALWCAIALLAVLPRALGLDHPLSNAEAANALLAFNALHGTPVAFPNPLFGWLQSLVFAVLGDSNVAARVIPALAGVALCLLPIALRERMGRARALWMGALLALSPTLWFASHQSGGAMLAWTLAFAAFCLWGRRPWLHGALAGALLACGQDAVAPFIVVALALLASGRLFAGATFDSSSTPNSPTPNSPTPSPREGRMRLPSPLGRGWGWGVAAGATFVMLASAFLLRPQGIGDAFYGVALWAQSVTAVTAFPLSRLAAGYALNDTLLGVAGFAGVIVLLMARRFSRDEWGWLAWAGAGLALLVVVQGRNATLLVPVAIAGAAFAAAALAALVSGVAGRDMWVRFGVAGALAFMLWVYAGLGLRQYAAMGQSSWLLPIAIALLLMLATVSGASLIGNVMPAVRGLLAGVAGAMLLHTLGAGLQMTLVKPDNAAEAYRADVAERGLAGVDEMIRAMSTRATGEPLSMAVAVPDEAPAALRWALRNQNQRVTAGQPAPAMMTRDGVKPADGNYIGHAYPIASTATLAGVGCAPQPQGGADCLPLARWIAFREAGAQQMENWVFWVRDDLAQEASGSR
jgi:hypothetical protein